MKNFDELLEAVRPHPVRKVAVAVAQDATVVAAAAEARKQNIAECVLVGDKPGKRTMLRSYWNNQTTGIVNDEVFELRMEPANWGEVTFQ